MHNVGDSAGACPVNNVGDPAGACPVNNVGDPVAADLILQHFSFNDCLIFSLSLQTRKTLVTLGLRLLGRMEGVRVPQRKKMSPLYLPSPYQITGHMTRIQELSN